MMHRIDPDLIISLCRIIIYSYKSENCKLVRMLAKDLQIRSSFRSQDSGSAPWELFQQRNISAFKNYTNKAK